MEELRMGLNHMKQKSRLHLEVHCDCEAICGVTAESQSTCVNSHGTYLGITRLWEAIVCPKDPHSKWHAQDCVFGICKDYGVDNLTFYPNEEEGTSHVLVSWKCFNMEKVVTKKGEEFFSLNLCIWKLTPRNLLLL
jgi:hypothetical protein